jgi:hypothetical protein
VLGIPATVTPILDSGPVSTKATTNTGNSILSVGSPTGLVGLNTAAWTQVTGGLSSTFGATINSANVNVSTLLGLAATTIASSSKTTCIPSTHGLAETGSTTIQSLTINGNTINLPNPIPPNDFILGNASSPIYVELNRQVPITDGLSVDAIFVHVNVLGIAGATVIVGHSESDLEGC